MKSISTILYITILLGSAASSTVFSADQNSSFGFAKLSVSLCSSAEQNDVVKLRTELTKARTHIRTVYPQISCDGQSLLSIAKSNQSDAVATYLQLKAKPEVTSIESRVASSNK